MKATQTCPKCAGRRFSVTRELRVPSTDGNHQTAALPALLVQNNSFFGSNAVLGTFEAWICLGCGYTELYAQGLAGVEELAGKHPDHTRIVDAGSPGQGPYR